MKIVRNAIIACLILLCTLPLLSGCKNGIEQYKIKEYDDITYKSVDNQDLKLDILLPTVHKYLKNPVVFYFHGGSWVGGDKRSDMDFMKPAIDSIRANGIAVVGVNYRFVSDTLKFPAPVNDCVDSISWIVKNAQKYDIDTLKMGAWGMSSGGYLALMTGFASSQFHGDSNLEKYTFKLKYVVDLCGPADFNLVNTDGFSAQAVEIMGYFIGGSLADDRAEYIKASPISYLTDNSPDLLIVHGESDDLVPISQSETLLSDAKKDNINAQIIKVENADHSFDPVNGSVISPTIDELFKSISDFVINSAK